MFRASLNKCSQVALNKTKDLNKQHHFSQFFLIEAWI